MRLSFSRIQIAPALRPALLTIGFAAVAWGCGTSNTAAGDAPDCVPGDPGCEQAPSGSGGEQGSNGSGDGSGGLAVCQQKGLECGYTADANGNPVACGECGQGELCVDGACRTTPQECEPSSCAGLGYECGQWSDGCGGTLACGGCAGDLLCDAGTCVNASGISHERVTNPFAGASFYVNPEYVANVRASKALAPSELTDAITKVESIPTAVWLDRIAMIDGDGEHMGIREHLEAALQQQAQSADPNQPMLVAFVIYDLPDRDCAALASNGELHVADNGLQIYETQYVDAIVARLRASPLYEKLRIVALVEPDSLPNLVTNLGLYSKCAEAADAYRQGVVYAISQLSQLDNVYIYLDIAHSGWLGWEHTAAAAQLYNEVLAAAGGPDEITGFVTNVANYSALQEPFDPYVDVNANRDLIENYYQWNRMIDEVTYVAALRQYFPDKGFIIDTSRDGWVPRAAGLPIENRTHRGNWCNITGAGLGERPRANPRPGIDAYFWIKPPGESDGTSDPTATVPNDEGKSYDAMCGTAPVERPYAPGELIPTDALPGAPHAGHWFHEQFLMLVRNATPPL